MANYKIGQKVAIINQTHSGRFVLEGYARVCEGYDVDGLWLVHFINDNGRLDEHGPVDRFIDDQAQADPKAFIAKLNR